MKKAQIFCTFALMAFALLSCEEEINLHLKTSATRLVVGGMITSDTTQHIITLAQSAHYFDSTQVKYISGALVEVMVADSTVVFTESDEHPGWYLSPEDFYGVPGNEYRLRITNVGLPGISTDEEFTASSIMPAIAPIDSASIGYSHEWDLWKIVISAQDPADQRNYYMFSLQRNGRQITKSLKEKTILDDRLSDGKYASEVWIFGLDTEEYDFQPNDTLTMECYNITKEFYYYVYAVQVEMQGSNPLFSGSPANVPGNISNNALGYFTACGVSRVDFINPYRIEDFK